MLLECMLEGVHAKVSCKSFYYLSGCPHLEILRCLVERVECIAGSPCVVVSILYKIVEWTNFSAPTPNLSVETIQRRKDDQLSSLIFFFEMNSVCVIAEGKVREYGCFHLLGDVCMHDYESPLSLPLPKCYYPEVIAGNLK